MSPDEMEATLQHELAYERGPAGGGFSTYSSYSGSGGGASISSSGYESPATLDAYRGNVKRWRAAREDQLEAELVQRNRRGKVKTDWRGRPKPDQAAVEHPRGPRQPGRKVALRR
jgi:hypothetical protein